MRTRRLLLTATAIAQLAVACAAMAQPSAPPPATTIQTSPAQLDDLLAPVALYPDDLLGDILMAASYPVEVVQADRWLADPVNAGLMGDTLLSAVEAQNWDPSVKSLTAFPATLHMMDNHLDWTESLGEAFVANPQAVTEAIQDLRRRAMAAGALRSTPQQRVSEVDGYVTIVPVSQDTVYYPAYDPESAYGVWPYPDFPPYAFDDFGPGCVPGDFGYCWFPVMIVAPFWGWSHWDWRHHAITVDPDRFTRLNNDRPPAGGATWVHERGHRHGVPYTNAETRARYPTAPTSQESERAARGFPVAPTMQGRASGGGLAVGARPSQGPPTFESFERGSGARADAARGATSRTSPAPAPASRPSAPAGSSGRRHG